MFLNLFFSFASVLVVLFALEITFGNYLSRVDAHVHTDTTLCFSATRRLSSAISTVKTENVASLVTFYEEYK